MGKVEKNPDCSVVVCSCDRYADLLGPFAALFRKFWPDCPFETVLVTETAPEHLQCFDWIIACGPGLNWASRLERALSDIVTPYVLLLCDDYLVSAPIDTANLLERLCQAKALNAVNLRLIPNPKPKPGNAHQTGSGLLEYHKDTAYCIATQAGLWNREFLRELARGKSSIWEFERYGSFELGGEPRPLLVTPTQEFPFVDAVHKGYWEKAGVALCKVNGVAIDFARRGLPPFRVRSVEALKDLVFAIFPWTLIVRVQNAFGLGAKERRAPREAEVRHG